MSSSRDRQGMRWFRSLRWRVALHFAASFLAVSLIAAGVAIHEVRTFLEKQTDRELREDLRQFAAIYERLGMDALKDEFQHELNAEGVDNVLIVFREANGRTLISQLPSDFSSPAFTGRLQAGLDRLGSGEIRFRDIFIPGTGAPVRVADIRLFDGSLLQIGSVQYGRERALRTIRKVTLLAAAGMMVIGTLLGAVATGQALRGVNQVAQAADSIGRTGLSARVPVSGPVEIEELARAFNQMLDRIENLVREMRTVTESVAHDLRLPLTRMRTGMETLLQHLPPDQKETRNMAGMVIEECDRLGHLMDTLLDIAEAQAGIARFRVEDVDLTAMARQTHEVFTPLAQEAGVMFLLDVPDEPVVIEGDPRRLQRMAANLVDNALKFTPAGGTVRIILRSRNGEAELVVEDTGCGIRPEDLPRIFDRFFRGDSSRTTPGNGLGLSLARAVAELHGGRIMVESRPGKGSRFTVRLPKKQTTGAIVGEPGKDVGS